MSTYTFLRWLRAGAAGAIADTEQVGRTEARATFQATVRVQSSTVHSASKALHVLGPGDVIGLDPQQIIRRVPEPNTPTADTQAFAHIELDSPDLPWRFTPFAEAGGVDAAVFGLKTARTLTPWLCLVVVERREGVSLSYTRGDLLPVLDVDDPSRELPDLAVAHAWAHVQLSGAPTTTDLSSLATWIDQNPRRTLARLVCPRLLASDTAYIACLVPVYALGAQAGLGALDNNPAARPKANDYAWTQNNRPVRLPVYDSWEFHTGAGGTFEDLVRRLQHVEDLSSVGVRTLDLSTPGWSIADDSSRPNATISGALRQSTPPPAWPGDPTLATEIADAIDDVQALAPPMYGRWHAATSSVPRGGGQPVWLGELNLDPGLRVAAALGTQVVQVNQETFMAAAWAQVGDILRANQLLRQAQVAVAASQRLHRRHFASLDPLSLLGVCGPALSRLRDAPGSTRTIYGRLASTCLTPIAFSGATRRILRVRGPLGRRIARARDGRPFDPTELLQALATRSRSTTPPLPSPLPTASVTVITNALNAAGFATRGGTELAQQLNGLRSRSAVAQCTPLDDASGLAAAALGGVDPAVTVPRRARARVSLPSGTWDPTERIDPIMVAPEITTPLFEPLRSLDPDWVLPGLNSMPANSVGAVGLNQQFVEAFLVGANHEMGRELLWRGFPTDQRGSVFRVFWDRRGSSRPDARDIDRVHEWSPASRLGAHDPARPTGTVTATDRFVLLVRGDLLARFPGTSVFCVRAEWSFDASRNAFRAPRPVAGRDVALPQFGGRFDPDVIFYGFEFDIATARGDAPPSRARTRASAGWFVVFQEQPTEPRFGIASEVGVSAGAPLGSWQDLGSPLVRTAGLRSGGTPPRPLGYVDLAATTQYQDFVNAVTSLNPVWDGRSDSLAAILLTAPFRLYLHATDLIGEPP